MANKPLEELIKEIPPPPEGSVFSLLRLQHGNHQPHPYCIGPKHVAYAADKCGGILSEEAIRGAEQEGARCYMGERSHDRCTVPYAQHTSELVCLLELPDNDAKKLNDVPGLGAYLTSIKGKCEELGIAGFGFVKKK